MKKLNYLTEEDIITMRERQVLLLGDVQSAKRLLKYRINNKLEKDGLLPTRKMFLDMIDACFQIPDGDDTNE